MLDAEDPLNHSSCPSVLSPRRNLFSHRQANATDIDTYNLRKLAATDLDYPNSSAPLERKQIPNKLKSPNPTLPDIREKKTF